MGNSFKPVPKSVSKLSENHKNWEIKSMILVTAIEAPPPFNCPYDAILSLSLLLWTPTCWTEIMSPVQVRSYYQVFAN